MQKEEKKSVSELGNERRRKKVGAERDGELHQQTLKIQGAGNDGNGSSKKQEK